MSSTTDTAPDADGSAGEPTAVSDLERLTAVHEITSLMTEYGRRFDHGAGTSVAELFVDGGRWSSPGITATGQAELQAFFRRREEMTERLTRHVVTNIDITVHSTDRATARSVAIEYRGTRGPEGMTAETLPALVGDYEDEFRRESGRWLFVTREVTIEFKRAGETFLRPER